MAVVTAAEAAAGLPLGAGAPGGMGQILQILQTINEIVRSPLATAALARFQGQNQGFNQPVIESGPHNVQPAAQAPQPGPAAAPAPAAVPVINEQVFMQYLSSPAGREKIAAGLEQVQGVAGADLTISQMIQILRSGNPLEKPPAAAEKK